MFIVPITFAETATPANPAPVDPFITRIVVPVPGAGALHPVVPS